MVSEKGFMKLTKGLFENESTTFRVNVAGPLGVAPSYPKTAITLARTCGPGKGFGPVGSCAACDGVAFVLGGRLCAWAAAHCFEFLKRSLNLPTCSTHSL